MKKLASLLLLVLASGSALQWGGVVGLSAALSFRSGATLWAARGIGRRPSA